MFKLNAIFTCSFICLCALFANHANSAEKDFRDYIVYYNVLTSDFLQPKIAKAYGITRAHDRILLNISIHRKKPNNRTTAVRATITASANDLIHNYFLNFKPIEEGSAIYYLGEFKAPGRQVYIFDLSIKPEDSAQTLTLRFNDEVFATQE